MIVKHLRVADGKLATAAVGYVQQALLYQTGTGTPSPGGAYVSFATAYGTPPIMSANNIGPFARTSGTVVGAQSSSETINISRVRPGSFKWAGTPSGRSQWFAWGLVA